MKFLLDTDVFSEAARDRNDALRDRLRTVQIDDLALSVITIGEIEFGLAKNSPAPTIVTRIEALRTALPLLAVDEDVARRYGHLRAAFHHAGKPIGPNDLWLAAHALSADLTLVTGNEREFRRVPTLRVDNWMR